ncbi:plasmid mobilization protein [Fodinibius salsisoli]|uniref:Plasmid mobilization relaxosome protein MobC n=1 Tax=Fodinibius salsisoli TaxID=2820877 RepID=A0ABT3PSH4_9BACT|nr:plasmid mobilization relaxosome protein MobC [Fodinibius salsisoli]MCW9708811.1 plasmid mobilization relaxosome protein MobC [Fodinibius salsisoli]
MNDKMRHTPSVSLQTDEKEWLKTQADKAGITYTNYMRKVALCQLPQAEIPFRKEDRRLPFKNGISQRDMERVIDYDLAKVGNNMNQIARKLNEGASADEKMIEQMDEIWKDIDQITNTILTALG